MRYFLLSVITLFIAMTASAVDIKGSVKDNSGDVLPDASIRLLSAADSTFVKGKTADFDGNFILTDIKSGKYIIEASYVGFKKSYVDVVIKSENVTLPAIVMSEDSHLLKETTVTGVKTPIKVMEDTIEYNADSYKTQPNAVVEDLLKRLPGVEVDSDGKITANGKEVKKILVDGKEFFSDDPKVASKNLPVNMVDKLQVVDRKSDLARLTGVDDGEEETVINLTVKKGMKNGWFGNAEVGYGTDDRYAGNFNINRFKDGNQVTLLGNVNNINNMGFNDGGSRFTRFGGSNGITTSRSLGMNFNVGNEEIFRIGGNVMWSNTDRHTDRRTRRQYIIETDPYTQNSLNNSRDKGHNVQADFRVEWKPDSFNTLDIRPQFRYNQNESAGQSFSVSEGKNMSFNRTASDGKSYEASGQIIYNHSFKQHRGRSFSISANYRMSNLREHDDSYVYNYFYQLKDIYGNDSIDTYDQYINNHNWSNNFSGRLSWTEPLGNPSKGNFLNFSYNANVRWNNADKITSQRDVVFSEDYFNYLIDGVEFNLPMPLPTDGDFVEIDSLSNRFRNTTIQHDIRIGYQHIASSYRLDIGLSAVPISNDSRDLINPKKNISRSVWNFAPYATFRYKFSKNSSVNLRYSGRTQQPSMSQLQPVADYSNPLNVRVGNPDLVPSFTHQLRIRQQHFDQESQRSIMSMLNIQLTQNSIISKTSYDTTTGGRHTTYENVNGIWNMRLMNMFSQPLRNKLFSFNNNFFVNYNRRLGYSNVGRDYARNVSNTYGINESFSFAFRPDNLELEIRPNYSYQATRNSVKTANSTNIHNFGAGFNGTWYTPIGIVLATDLNFRATRGYSRGYNEDTWMWNASISYQFLDGKNATIMLRAYDLLQQKKNIMQNVTASYIEDTSYNDLTRYFMISFSYKFNTFGKGGSRGEEMPGEFGPGFNDGPMPGREGPRGEGPRGEGPRGGGSRGGRGPFGGARPPMGGF